MKSTYRVDAHVKEGHSEIHLVPVADQPDFEKIREVRLTIKDPDTALRFEEGQRYSISIDLE